MPNLEIVDWVTSDALILSPVGELDPDGCQALKSRLHALLSRWPEARLVIDFASIAAVDPGSTEALFIEVVGRRAQGGAIMIARPSLPVRGVLKAMNLDFWTQLPTERAIAGVTA